MIELKHVSKKYEGFSGTFHAVDDVSLTIQKQEIFGVIGESGAGKSTLLRFINALEAVDQGEVFVDGLNIAKLSKRQLRQHRKHISMVFQQFNLLNNKTVRENVLLPLELHHYKEHLNVNDVLEFVGLADKANHYPSQLSGGQKQRVGIARALITKPSILLCDEPTSALDATMTDEIVAVLKRAHQKFGMTIVIVTHELEVIQNLCHRAAILEAGKLMDLLNIEQTNQVKARRTYHERVLEVLAKDA